MQKNLVTFGLALTLTGHILDLYCVRLSNPASFCKNYAKLYFDAKLLEKGLNRGVGEIFVALFLKKCSFFKKSALFHKRVPFLTNIKCCSKFLECAVT